MFTNEVAVESEGYWRARGQGDDNNDIVAKLTFSVSAATMQRGNIPLGQRERVRGPWSGELAG